MKVLLVGAHGVIGSAVARELGARHTLVRAGRSQGDVKVDITDSASIRRMFEQVGRVDAVVSAAGNVHFAPLEDMTEQHFDIGLRDKLMGQVNLAMIGRAWLNDGGSITVTGGILAEQPIRNGSSASLVNSALEGFVRGAAIELPRGLRINLVSPNVVQESLPQLAPFFRGFEAVPAARVALGYSRSVEGHQTGQIYRVF
ncbi:short chain dehydrogenase [Archangium violaceum]|uniref:short chain dehydrogenase n=1 Tax=Archangium violaceum TaxID=83451 RepID=UPI002B31F443|nr:short chain dehydrogenase [Archangium violaceum]